MRSNHQELGLAETRADHVRGLHCLATTENICSTERLTLKNTEKLKQLYDDFQGCTSE